MNSVEYAIVGAGPAGLQLSYLLQRSGIRHVVLDREAVPGGYFQTYPRHRQLISINKVYTGQSDPEVNLRWDWNSLLSEDGPLFKEFSKDYFPEAKALLQYMHAFAQHFELPIRYQRHVESISRSGEGFTIRSRVHETSDKQLEELHAKRVIVATGVSLPFRPEFPGVELCECYSEVSVNPEDFLGQRVLILGKGNSAFETANHLVGVTASIHVASPNPLKMAWRTHFVGHLRAVNNTFLDTYQLKSQNAVLDAEVTGIEKRDGDFHVTFAYQHAGGEVETLKYDRVILCTGFRFDTSIFDESCKPELRSCGRLPMMTDEWESTNIPHLFFAGTLMQMRDYKKYMSSFIHGFRYNIRALTRQLEARYHDTPWPRRSVHLDEASLCDAVLARVNRSSALWQQPGFLCDLVDLDSSGQSGGYLEELPVDHARRAFMNQGRWLMVTLEFGPMMDDPFSAKRVHREDAARAADSHFLHPIVRWFEGGVQIDEHHVLEDLAAEWREPEHILPLTHFLVSVLAGVPLERTGRVSQILSTSKSSGTATDASHKLG